MEVREDSIPKPSAALAQQFAPQTIKKLVGADDERWLAEFRNVTSIFVSIENLSADQVEISQLQSATECLQSIFSKFDGAINQFVVDDKGLTLVGCFGIANSVHEDDAIRALFTSREISSSLSELGLQSKIGVATDTVFVGQRGSAIRQEMALIGNSVNLSARLMTAADDILCDASTMSLARKRFFFETPLPVQLKGMLEPVQAYRPQSPKDRSFTDEYLLGREAECNLLNSKITDLDTENSGGVVRIVGAPGIGKSRLMNYVLERTQATTIRVFRGSADSIESSTAFFALRPIVSALFGVSPTTPVGTIIPIMEDLYKERSSFNGALLSPLLYADLPRHETVDRMNPLGRMDALSDLLVQFIESKFEDTRVLLLIEDAHWLDEASQYLLVAIAQRLSHVLIIVSERPGSDYASMSQEIEDQLEIKLEELGRDDATTLLCRALEVDSVPQDVAKYVFERSGGQPLFTEQLARALRHHDSIKIQNGECMLVDADALTALDLPFDISSVITSTIDTLSAEEQLVLKIASVVGLEFQVELLQAIVPNEIDERRLLDSLNVAKNAGLIQDGEQGFRFKHALIQTAIYDILSSEQRTDLHNGIGLYLEDHQDVDLNRSSNLLGHHFESAANIEKAVKYLEIAGSIALDRDHANKRAADIFKRIIKLADSAPEAFKTDVRNIDIPGAKSTTSALARRGNWFRSLGDAQTRIGEPLEAADSLAEALRLLGQPFPMSKSRIVWAVASGLFNRMLFKPKYPTSRTKGTEQRSAVEDSVAAFERYVRVCYAEGKSLEGIASSLRALPLAEYLGPSREYCSEYSLMANVIATTGRIGLADCYGRLSIDVALNLDDKSAEAHAKHRSSLYRMQLADDSIKPAFHRAIEVFDELGDYHESAVSHLALGRVEFRAGNYTQAQEYYEAGQDRSRKGGSTGLLSWAQIGIAELLFRKGQFEEASRFCLMASELIDSHHRADNVALFQNEGLLAQVAVRNKQIEQAWKHAQKSIEAHDKGGWLTYSASPGYMGIFETLLILNQESGSTSSEYSKLISRLLKKIRRHRSRRVVIPFYFYYGALQDIQLGKTQRAKQLLNQGVELTTELRMPFERALMLRELARIAETESDRSTLSNEATELFTNLDAHAEIEILQRHVAA